MLITTRPLPLAAALAAVSFAVAAAPARADELANLINAWRTAPGTCDGRPAPPVERLAVEPALSRIRIGPGTFLESALQDAGYQAEHAEAITVSGPPDARAALDAIGQPYCRTLRAAEFAAIGTAHVGTEWQIVLARPVVIPPLPDWPAAGQDILALVNAARARPRTCGTRTFGPAGPLAWNPLLGRAALAHSTDMAQKHYFNHEQPDGSLPADRATAAGYRWVRVGENIASGQRTPEEAVASWLDSPGHCANIMNPAFTEMGAAYAINPRNRNRTAYWTQVFGTPL
ncbi:CAP domain-containing protein [Massilia rhizosphaerae]|uniref:CAP domain-containing protein n=1 Tax=Massilia rhizosphaerae TaxID=2784389 RepID=UPI0018DCA186|nr:CAP domain-containing protein [Massilia rhizosphaerae]